MLRLTKKADRIAVVIGGKVNKRFVVTAILKAVADHDGELTEQTALASLTLLTDDTLGSGTPESFIKAFIRRGYLEVV